MIYIAIIIGLMGASAVWSLSNNSIYLLIFYSLSFIALVLCCGFILLLNDLGILVMCIKEFQNESSEKLSEIENLLIQINDGIDLLDTNNIDFLD